MEHILNNLCSYDPRNPNRVVLDEYPPFPNQNCSCDNCFYGRTKLANSLHEMVNELTELLETFKACLGGSDPLYYEDFKEDIERAQKAIDKAKNG